MSKIKELLKPFPIQTKIPVQWGEMDAFRHVNNLVYLRWSETGRIEYFRSLGLNSDEPEKAPFGPILGWQDCKYIFPITYPDTVYVGTTVTEIESERFNMQCHIFSEQHDRVVAISNHRIVILDYKKSKKIPVPDSLIKRIEELEGKRTFKK